MKDSSAHSHAHLHIRYSDTLCKSYHAPCLACVSGRCSDAQTIAHSSGLTTARDEPASSCHHSLHCRASTALFTHTSSSNSKLFCWVCMVTSFLSMQKVHCQPGVQDCVTNGYLKSGEHCVCNMLHLHSSNAITRGCRWTRNATCPGHDGRAGQRQLPSIWCGLLTWSSALRPIVISCIRETVLRARRLAGGVARNAILAVL